MGEKEIGWMSWVSTPLMFLNTATLGLSCSSLHRLFVDGGVCVFLSVGHLFLSSHPQCKDTGQTCICWLCTSNTHQRNKLDFRFTSKSNKCQDTIFENPFQIHEDICLLKLLMLKAVWGILLYICDLTASSDGIILITGAYQQQGGKAVQVRLHFKYYCISLF